MTRKSGQGAYKSRDHYDNQPDSKSDSTERKSKRLKTEHRRSGDAGASFGAIPDKIAQQATASLGDRHHSLEEISSKLDEQGHRHHGMGKKPMIEPVIEDPVPNKRQKRQDERREARQQKKAKKLEDGNGKDTADVAAHKSSIEGVEMEVNEAQHQAAAPRQEASKRNGREKRDEVKNSSASTAATNNSKQRKRKHDRSDETVATTNANANRIPVDAKRRIASEEDGEDAVPKNAREDSKKDKSQRFIAFIGNLPYTANSESITKHFSGIAPFHVRAPTDPSTGKSKGYAFLEFEGYDKMKSCLKLYHHSNFGEGKKARKINVELTAGGGGNTEARKAKIKEKNDKLKEERKKAHEDEAKGRQGSKRTGLAQADGAADNDTENADIHPSRRKRMGL